MLQANKILHLKGWKQRIIQVLPILFDHFVLAAVEGPHLETVYHLAADGHVIRKRNFIKSNIQTIQAVTTNMVVFLHEDQNMLIQWNIETDQVVSVPLSPRSRDCFYQLLVFPWSKQVCVCSREPQSSSLHINYYQYPLNPSSKPNHSFSIDQSSTSGWTSDSIVKRADLSSKVVWYASSRTPAKLKFNVYGPDQGLTTLSFSLENEKYCFSIIDVWKLENSKWIAHAFLNNTKQLGSPQVFQTMTFLCDQYTSKMNPICLKLNEKSGLYQILDCLFMGHLCILRTFLTKNDYSTFSIFNMHYINLKQLQQIHKETVQKLGRQETVAYDPDLFIDVVIAPLSRNQPEYTKVVVNMVKFSQPKELHAFLLDQYVENVEEDLVYMVLVCLQLVQ